MLKVVKNHFGRLAGIEVSVNVQRDMFGTVLIVNPVLAGECNSAGYLLGVVWIVVKDKIELALVDGLVRQREIIADVVDHFFDPKSMDIREVAAGVGAFKAAMAPQCIALVPHVLDGSIAHFASNEIRMKIAFCGRDNGDCQQQQRRKDC